MNEHLLDQIVFVDTETTGLDLWRHEIWEACALWWNGTSWEVGVWQPKLSNLDRADPKALEIGHFNERSCDVNDKISIPNFLDEFLIITAGKHIAGACVDFDTYRIQQMAKRLDWEAKCKWHYHLIDIENLAVGYLSYLNRQAPKIEGAEDSMAHQLPWKSRQLYSELGVTWNLEEEHTALGDAILSAKVYCHVMGIDIEATLTTKVEEALGTELLHGLKVPDAD